MTNEEFKKICEIIDSEIITDYTSAFNQKRVITVGGVAKIKEKIKKLVKERRY